MDQPPPKIKVRTPFEGLEWARLSQAVGLGDEEARDRVIQLLVLHFLLDRLLAVALSVRMARTADATLDFQDIIKEVSGVTFYKRVQIARAVGIIPADAAADLKKINKVRNDIVHFKPKEGGGGWDIDLPGDVFTASAKKGFTAAQVLMEFLRIGEGPRR